MARRQKGEGSVFQRQDGRWVGTLDLGWVDGKRSRKTVYGRTQREAVKRLGQVKLDLSAGHVTTASLTVETYARYWLETIAPKRVKPTTLPTYRTYVERYIIPAIGKKRIDRLTAADVRAVHDKASGDGRSSTTANHAHWVLSGILEAALRDGKTPRNVAKLEDAPDPASSQRGALSTDQAGALLAAVTKDRMASRWLLALMLGARQGECLGLTWPCVDFANHTISFAWQLQRVRYRHGCKTPCGRRADRCKDRTLDVPDRYAQRHLEGNHYLLAVKTKKPRMVAMPPPLEAALYARGEAYERERTGYPVDHDLVWAREDGRPIDGRADYLAWQHILRTAGLPPMPLHSARHTAATILDALGASEAVRMSILGHSQAATTLGYTHVDTASQLAVLRRMSELLQIGTK